MSSSLPTTSGGTRWRLMAGLVGLTAVLATLLLVLRPDGPAPEPQPSVARQVTPSGEATRFVVFGHLYPIAKEEAKLAEFIRQVNSEKADLVFVLGDSLLEEKAVVDRLRSELEAEVHFTPGNHELKGERRKSYLENVGYMQATVDAPDIHFLLVNSSIHVSRIKAFVERSLQRIDDEAPTVLLTHHRIWDDTLLSPLPMQHDKSFYFDELEPVLQGRVDAIFAGNSKRQYFRDLKTSPHYGPQNLNNVYWADQIGEITAYSVGVGDGVPKAGYVVVDVVDGRLLLTARAIAWDGKAVPDRRYLQPTRRSKPPEGR